MGIKHKKSLRIGVIQSGRLIEEFIVKQRAPVGVGRNIKNSVVLADHSLPSRYKLFTCKNGRYHLNVTPQMKAELKNPSKHEWIDQQKRSIPLSLEDKGKVTINETTILFQFIEPPRDHFVPRRLPAQFRNRPRNMVDWRFMAPLLFSIVIHVAWTNWMLALDLSTQPITMAEIPDRFREAIIETPKKEPQKEEIKEKKVNGDGEKKKIKKPVKIVKKEKPEALPKGKTAKDIRKARAKISISGNKTIKALRQFKRDGRGIGIVDDHPTGTSLNEIVSHIPGNKAGSAGPGSGVPGIRGPGSGDYGGTGINRIAKVAVATNGVKIDKSRRTLKTQRVKRIAIKPRGDTRNLKIPEDPNINKGSARKAVKKAMERATGCYQREAKKNNAFAGRVKILIVVGGDGKPLSVEIIQTKLNDPSLGYSMNRCIKQRLKRVRFPKPAKPPISIQFTAVFSPGG